GAGNTCARQRDPPTADDARPTELTLRTYRTQPGRDPAERRAVLRQFGREPEGGKAVDPFAVLHLGRRSVHRALAPDPDRARAGGRRGPVALRPDRIAGACRPEVRARDERRGRSEWRPLLRLICCTRSATEIIGK